MKKIIDSNHLLDTIRQEHGLKNDSALCVKLGVGRPQISKMRHLKTGLNDEFRVLLMRKLGMTLFRIDQLAPPDA
jgi:hypothetical protein